MNRLKPPTELAATLLNRSVCAVQVGAVLTDPWGVFSWGWNSSGAGFGEHAEAHAIRRSNKKRLRGSTIYVAAMRRRGKRGKIITAKPCQDCARLLKGWGVREIVYRDGEGNWKEGDIS